MRTFVVASALLGVVVGCGSTREDTSDVANFIGGEWTGTDTTTDKCNDESVTFTFTDTVAWHFVFEPSGTGGFKQTSSDGCTLEFNVNGGTGTFANGPVKCRFALDAGTQVVDYKTFTVSSSNGSQLNATVGGTTMLNGIECSFKSTIAATR